MRRYLNGKIAHNEIIPTVVADPLNENCRHNNANKSAMIYISILRRVGSLF